LVPRVLLIGVLINPTNPPAALQLRQIEDAARAMNQRILVASANTDEELDAAFTRSRSFL
jgi:hypothetical protein